ncbi:MAG: cupin domain-containing protein [Flavobacterium sp.]|nr:MAG: cupin domain-containing protein [Flavobacterium sp.]
MKAIKTIAMLFFVGALFLSPKLHAQDPMTLGKMYKKVILENDKVRIMSVVFAPGDVMPWHNHPAHTVTVITGGKIEITTKGEAPVTSEVKAGDVMYVAPVTHMAKNVGKTTINLVVTELKGQM